MPVLNIYINCIKLH